MRGAEAMIRGPHGRVFVRGVVICHCVTSIDGVDVVKALAVRLIAPLVALVHRIDAQKARRAARFWLAPLANSDPRRTRFLVVQMPFAIALGVAQVVEMRGRDPRQMDELRSAVDMDLALYMANPHLIPSGSSCSGRG